MVDIRQSEEYSKYIESLGWKVEKTSWAYVFVKQLPIIGSIIKIQRPETVDFKEIDQIAKKYRALFVKVEPITQLKLEGFTKDNWPLLPTKTLRINLERNLDEIFKSMDKDTRYCIRKSDSLKVIESTDINQFYEILKASMKIGKWEIPIKNNVLNLYKAYPKAKIIFAKKDGVAVSGSMLIFSEGVCHFMYAGNNNVGRKNFGAYRVVWECIKISKQIGYKFFDFEGVYDERFPKNNKGWLGFTLFKSGFGGEPLYYPGSFIKYYSPILKLLFRLF